MGWNFSQQGNRGTGVAKDFIDEGNLPVYMPKTEQDRIRFLIKPFDLEGIAAANSITSEEANELVMTTLYLEDWMVPIEVWEHNIPGIQGERYYSTHVCPGSRECPLCEANNEKKEQGITENKLLPYPWRKRFLAPIWVYRLKKVLYLKQSQFLFEEMNAYIEKNGLDIDFDVWKTGKGPNTRYHSIFLGKAERSIAQIKPVIVLPKDIDWENTPESLAKKLGKTPRSASNDQGGQADPGKAKSPPVQEQAKPTVTEPVEEEPEVIEMDLEVTEETTETTVPETVGTTEDSPGDFVVTFGSNKGMSLQEIFDADKLNYLEFLKNKSVGAAQVAAEAFLKEQTG